MTVGEMIGELLKVSDKSMEVMIGIDDNFVYLDAEDMGITTFGIPCDEQGMPLETGEDGPTVFTMIVSTNDDYDDDWDTE
jgi:hypothetical protein